MLDLVAKRYPGTRPSDLYGRLDPSKPVDHPDNKGKLDEYQAFELDSALAFRYEAIEKDDFKRIIHEVKQAIRLTGRYHGIKKIRYDKYHSAVADSLQEEDEDETPEKANDQVIKLTKGSVIQ